METTHTAASGSPALRVANLAKRFDGAAKPVFSDVSFSIPPGQSVAIIGPNGAGKSTLMRCCVRLIEPDSGHIELHGATLSGRNHRELRRARQHCSFVFQKHGLVPRLSVLSNVLHGGLAHHSGLRHWSHSFASASERERALDCLDQVGLADIAAQRCDRISGGQSQRVAIARALMQRPKILFADEPTASLDPQSGQTVMELFASLGRRHGLTLMFVSHHMEHALDYADRIIGLRQNRLALDAASGSETRTSLRAFFD